MGLLADSGGGPVGLFFSFSSPAPDALSFNSSNPYRSLSQVPSFIFTAFSPVFPSFSLFFFSSFLFPMPATVAERRDIILLIPVELRFYYHPGASAP